MLTKACPTYDTKAGMFAVIAKYDRNLDEDRMVGVFMDFFKHKLRAAQHLG